MAHQFSDVKGCRGTIPVMCNNNNALSDYGHFVFPEFVGFLSCAQYHGSYENFNVLQEIVLVPTWPVQRSRNGRFGSVDHAEPIAAPSRRLGILTRVLDLVQFCRCNSGTGTWRFSARAWPSNVFKNKQSNERIQRILPCRQSNYFIK